MATAVPWLVAVPLRELSAWRRLPLDLPLLFLRHAWLGLLMDLPLPALLWLLRYAGRCLLLLLLLQLLRRA